MAAAGSSAAKVNNANLGSIVNYFSEYEALKTKARTPPWPEAIGLLTTGGTTAGHYAGQTVTYCNAMPAARTFTAADLGNT